MRLPLDPMVLRHSLMHNLPFVWLAFQWQLTVARLWQDETE